MNLHDFQLWTKSTAVYPKDRGMEYLITGLCAEAGEVAGKYAKHVRGDKDFPVEELIMEVGDVLWFCARICDEQNIQAEEVLQAIYNKLEDRKKRNVIKGSGDNR